MQVVQEFERNHANPQAGALFAWAAWTVESLHYLDDIDRSYDTLRTAIDGHRRDVVDVAHARWATSTCITALDLCAAGLGRSFCGHSGVKEFDLGSFALKKPSSRQAARRADLPVLALHWVNAVLSDMDYLTIKAARDWLIHSRLNRHLSLSGRLKLQLETTQVDIRHVVLTARDLATQHVSALFIILPNL